VGSGLLYPDSFQPSAEGRRSPVSFLGRSGGSSDRFVYTAIKFPVTRDFAGTLLREHSRHMGYENPVFIELELMHAHATVYGDTGRTFGGGGFCRGVTTMCLFADPVSDTKDTPQLRILRIT
ncbi:MAG: hypothetical protein TR69_WS6001000001, partial [candidate division WS6 bacterium OLB20]